MYRLPLRGDRFVARGPARGHVAAAFGRAPVARLAPARVI
jgi:hypothetical protein